MSRFLDRLRSGRILLMDGAMGTELARRGARLGADCLELWNLTRPAEVQAIHRAYLDAGAECLLTNTFQANPTALAGHCLERRLCDIWQAALQLARNQPHQDAFVLASIGPLATTKLLDAWREAIAIHEAISEADAILLETLFDTIQLAALVRANFLPRLGLATPVLASFSFRRDPDGQLRTSHRHEPPECARWAEKLGVSAVGVNCGVDMDMDDLLEVVRAYRLVTDLPLFVRPNAGTPDAQGHYPRTPEAMAAKLPALLDAGVTMVGGCCGTTPAHIAAFHEVIEARQVAPP